MKQIRSKTCIAVVKDKKRLWMAGERRLNWDDGLVMASTRPKISFREGLLLGASGLGYLCSEVVDFFPIPAFDKENYTTSEYMQVLFMPGLLQYLREQGHMVRDERRLMSTTRPDEDFGVSVLVGVGTDLFEVALTDGGCAFDLIPTPYATGCGQPYALASLMTTQALESMGSERMKPKDRLTLALQVAAHLSPGCDSNIDILHN